MRFERQCAAHPSRLFQQTVYSFFLLHCSTELPDTCKLCFGSRVCPGPRVVANGRVNVCSLFMGTVMLVPSAGSTLRRLDGDDSIVATPSMYLGAVSVVARDEASSSSLRHTTKALPCGCFNNCRRWSFEVRSTAQMATTSTFTWQEHISLPILQHVCMVVRFCLCRSRQNML